MKIYGVALLAFCFLTGKYLGYTLGSWLGLSNDVGGVGFAMLLLILSNAYLKRQFGMNEETQSGILFWSAMYIPIVIAMAATQNVKAAITGGPTALLAGLIATLLGFVLVPLLSRIGQNNQTTKSI